jgi:hypothetical protein
MKPGDRVVLMADKGTLPPDPPVPVAFAKCSGCDKELVYSARFQKDYESVKVKPMCASCAAVWASTDPDESVQ